MSINVEIITIGDEILIGQIVDTNSAWMAQQLNLYGFSVIQISSVSDNKELIKEALNEAEARASIILITGGLGPTKDDLTKSTLCEYFDSTLMFNEEVYQDVELLFKDRGLEVTPLNRMQAEVPDKCKVIRNKVGTAPGMWFEKQGKIYISMPGVPYEMKTMMQNEILPQLKKQFVSEHILHHTLLTQGIGESILAEEISEWENALPENFKLAYLPSVSSVRLRLTATGFDYDKLKSTFDKQINTLKEQVYKYCYGENGDSLEKVVGDMLKSNHKTISTAESCTGGHLAAKITKVPGSSAYYKGSVIAYANETKQNLLEINPDDLEQFGAVSRQVVEGMAKGVMKKLQTDYAIATSGIAGPDGGTANKPVGMVWIAIAEEGRVFSKYFLLGNDRGRVIEAASLTALNLFRRFMLNEI